MQNISKAQCVAIFVLYNPEPQVKHAIDTILEQGLEVIAVDNSNISNESLISFANKKNRFTYMPLLCNKGLSFAYNYALSKIYEQKQYYFTFDQDSRIDRNYIEQMLEAFSAVYQEDKETKVVAPVIVDKNAENPGVYSHNLGYLLFRKKKIDVPGVFVNTNIVINSGALHRLTGNKNIDYYDTSLFIDHVDTEYCIRQKVQGKSIYTIANIHLIHEIGQREKTLGFISTHHGPRRRYDSGFGYGYVLRKYLTKVYSVIAFSVTYMLYNSISILLVDTDKTEKLKCFWTGFFHGLKGSIY